MRGEELPLPGVRVFTPPRFGDARGRFAETWRLDRYSHEGVPGMFVQDNLSVSVRGTLRGLHFQHPRAQGKLIMAAWGSVFDVVVDVRQDSSTFGRWVGLELSEENGRQVWIPPGFAHGFAVLSDTAMLLYKCTDYYAPEHEHTVRWNDPAIAVAWPLASPILSAKDAGAPLLGDLSPHQLPRCDVDAG